MAAAMDTGQCDFASFYNPAAARPPHSGLRTGATSGVRETRVRRLACGGSHLIRTVVSTHNGQRCAAAASATVAAAAAGCASACGRGGRGRRRGRSVGAAEAARGREPQALDGEPEAEERPWREPGASS